MKRNGTKYRCIQKQQNREIMKILRTISITCLFSLIFTLTSHAQEKGTSEINLGYGYATSVSMMSAFDDIITGLFISDQINGGSIGAFFLSYDYAIADKLMLGAIFAYETGKTKYENNDNSLVANGTTNAYTFAIEINYNYVSKPSFRIYSGLGLGFTAYDNNVVYTDNTTPNDDASINSFNFQLTGIGIRVGKKLAFFAEAGYGYKGIVSAGLNLQF
jgi:hypothetical protein